MLVHYVYGVILFFDRLLEKVFLVRFVVDKFNGMEMAFVFRTKLYNWIFFIDYGIRKADKIIYVF